MAKKSADTLPDRVGRLLRLADDVEAAAINMTQTADPEWRRRRRTDLLTAAVRYGVAMQRALRPPRVR